MTRIFTVIGGAGRIGSRLVTHLREQGHDVRVGTRRTPVDAVGHVIMAAGVTSDFRTRPQDTVAAHTTLVAELLATDRFESLLYLSSTRLYRRAEAGREASSFLVDPAADDALYDLSKLTGEALCRAAARSGRNVRIARLAHIYERTFSGPGFLDRLVRAARDGHIALATSRASTRTFIAMDLAVDLLARLAVAGRHEVYNVAAPPAMTHGAIVDTLAAVTGCSVEVAADAPLVTEPPVSIDRAREEFDFRPRSLQDELTHLVESLPTTATAP